VEGPKSPYFTSERKGSNRMKRKIADGENGRLEKDSMLGRGRGSIGRGKMAADGRVKTG
jgi:hypothetical protein